MEELLEYMREYLFEHQAEYEAWLKKRKGGESNEENKRRTSKRIKEGF